MIDTYATIADIAEDERFRLRVAACAAQQGAGGGGPTHWAYEHRYETAAAPGWAAAVDSWKAANPGQADGWQDDQAVISDLMILAQVQALIAG